MIKMSLRTKGLIFIILISFVPLLIVALNNYISVKNDIVATEIDKITLKQESRSFGLSSWLETRKAEVLVMSRTNEVRSGDTNKMMEYLQQEQSHNSFLYQEIGFISQDRVITSLRGKLHLNVQVPITHALRGDIVVTDPVTINKSNDRYAYISVPVYGMDKSNQLIGALYVAYSFPPKDYKENLQIDEGNLYLYNYSGELLYDDLSVSYGNQQDILLRDQLKQLAALALTKNAGYKQVEIMSETYILFYQAVANTNWVILEVTNLGEIEKHAAPTLWRMLIVASIAVLLLVIVFYFFFQKIVSRLVAILQVTKQAAAGDFNSGHLYDGNHDEIGVLANTVNIMMSRLQIMFDRLDAVINQNKSPVIVMDERYVITYINQAAEKMLGYTSEQIVGKSTPIIFIDPEEQRLLAQKFSKTLGKELEPGIDMFLEIRNHFPNYEYELTITTRDGKRIPVYNRSSALRDRSGDYSGVIVILNDISEQRKLESERHRLQMVIESAKDLIASVDRQANIIYINEAGRKILGLSPEDSSELMPLKSLLPAHLYRQLQEGAAIARRQGFYECEAQLQNNAGKFISASLIIVAYEDSFTGETLYSCIARDITEQLEVQRKLVKATEAAEEANQAKSTFLALMSHEIRTPLNGILGLVQLLQKTELDHLQKEYVQHMKDSSTMLLSIVNDILDFSKLEAKKIEPDVALFQLHLAINYLSEQLSLFLGGKEQFEFKIDIEDNVPNQLLGDSLRLEQILSNLCVNAIKFTERGLVELHISVVYEHEDEIVLRFTVKDTGIGMSEEQVKNLFKPFKQADSSTTRKYGGTGLGLVISKNLVEMLGGKLEVTSELHKGSTFSFTMPFKKAAYQFTVEMAKLPDSSETLVWIVEDHDEMANQWMSFLEKDNYISIRLRTWKEAYFRLMRLGEGAYPALILMDMEMNDMYGMETWLAFQRIASSRGISIVALTTAYGREEMLVLDPAQQPSAILTKPVTASRFKEAVELAVHIKQSQKQLDKEQKSLQEELHSVDQQAAPTVEQTYQVLLAEDNRVNQIVAAEMLKLCNCIVTIANNGAEAVQYAQTQSFDLVLMDIHMPEMDGVEATKLIRTGENNSDVPIVAVTANVVASDHESYRLQGMNEVITKPISIDKLQKVLNKYIARHRVNNHKNNEPRVTRESDEIIFNKLVSLNTIQAKQAIERVNGKLNIYLHMLEQYLNDYSTFITNLKHYYKHHDYAEITRALHTLKGASSYLGAHKVQELAIEGEKIAREQQTTMLPSYFERLESELNQLLTDIATIVNKK